MHFQLFLFFIVNNLLLAPVISDSLVNSNLSDFQVKNTKVEVREGDFIYRLVTEKSDYKVGEDVKIYAELEYIGPKNEVTIYYSASPFYFPMFEKTRGYKMEYPMAESLLKTKLKRGKPYREEYTRVGAYIAEDDKDFNKFMENFIEYGFPVGFYIVSGIADFFQSDDPNLQERNSYKIQAQIEFKVVN